MFKVMNIEIMKINVHAKYATIKCWWFYRYLPEECKRKITSLFDVLAVQQGSAAITMLFTQA